MSTPNVTKAPFQYRVTSSPGLYRLTSEPCIEQLDLDGKHVDWWEVTCQDTNATAVLVRPDGLFWWFLGRQAGPTVYQFKMAIPWSISSSEYEGYTEFTDEKPTDEKPTDEKPTDVLEFQEKGLKFQINGGTVHQVQKPWDILTITPR